MFSLGEGLLQQFSLFNFESLFQRDKITAKYRFKISDVGTRLYKSFSERTAIYPPYFRLLGVFA